MGVGLTVNVNEMGIPWQAILLLVYTGVTVTVALEEEELLEFTAVNIPIFPVPDEARPMEVLLLLQL